MLNRLHAGIPRSGRGMVAKGADTVATIGVFGSVITGEIDDMFVLPLIGFFATTLFAFQQEQDGAKQEERDGPADGTARD
jgi:hypothetical protein